MHNRKRSFPLRRKMLHQKIGIATQRKEAAKSMLPVVPINVPMKSAQEALSPFSGYKPKMLTFRI